MLAAIFSFNSSYILTDPLITSKPDKKINDYCACESSCSFHVFESFGVGGRLELTLFDCF